MTESVTIIDHLVQNARTRGTSVAYRDKLTGTWRSSTWSDYDQRSREVARALMHLGIGKGDVVTILGPNRPEWALSAVGAMRAGGIAAGIYTTGSPDEVGYVVRHAESKVLVAENTNQLAKVLEVWDTLPDLHTVVLMDGSHDDERVLSWSDLTAAAANVSDADLDTRYGTVGAEDLAVFIYTSGTTGPPKAVMLTHDNLLWTCTTLATPFDIDEAAVTLSYLPLSHIAEMSASILMPITYGYEVAFCHDGLRLAEFLPEVRPTTFFGVPRVWERFEAGITNKLEEATGVKAKLIDWARGVASEYVATTNRGETPSSALTKKYNLANKVVLEKVKAAIGLERADVLVSGAAPIPAESLEFFASLGMTIYEVYGQSEDTGPTTCNFPGQVKYGTVGKLFDGIEVKLGDDDEILVRGKNVFAGYYKDEAATNETLIDGWLHSGDLGSFDSDGYLSIVGRKKDIIITSGGKNIAPKNIEADLSRIDIIEHAVVIGEQQRYLIALLTLEPEASARFAEEHGIDVASMPENPIVREHLDKAISAEVNSQLARVEHVRNYTVLPHQFSVDTGELTPTLKVKRAPVSDIYAEQINAVYAAGQVLE
ncbi:MAG: AMP-binding protein [Acidimicrobiales bacterium]|nr:AMP-binding protein [Acidimicrobiales bacterium]RZV47565.1 MAG: long-chain fatty acid--CoA ligase [Acidimicrobiales bacterium]